MSERTPFQQLKIAEIQQRQKHRAAGWTRCPKCEGMGNIGDRFTHQISVCVTCNGYGLVPPAKGQGDE